MPSTAGEDGRDTDLRGLTLIVIHERHILLDLIQKDSGGRGGGREGGLGLSMATYSSTLVSKRYVCTL